MDKGVFEVEDTMTTEENLGYSFSEKNLLNRALTRKAYALEQEQRNQDCEDQEIAKRLKLEKTIIKCPSFIKFKQFIYK